MIGISSFCVTPYKYNHSAYTWDQLSEHLRGYVHHNLSLDISQLQAAVSNMQIAHLQLLPETDSFEKIEESLHKLNLMVWIKTLRRGLLGTIISGCICLIVLCLVLRYTRETIQELMKKEVVSDSISIPAKEERGICSGNS